MKTCEFCEHYTSAEKLERASHMPHIWGQCEFTEDEEGNPIYVRFKIKSDTCKRYKLVQKPGTVRITL